jgi:hypothetical protein
LVGVSVWVCGLFLAGRRRLWFRHHRHHRASVCSASILPHPANCYLSALRLLGYQFPVRRRDLSGRELLGYQFPVRRELSGRECPCWLRAFWLVVYVPPCLTFLRYYINYLRLFQLWRLTLFKKREYSLR